MTPEQLAEKACVSVKTVTALLAAKVLMCVVHDGQRLIRWEDWEVFVATCPVSEWFI
ncbi:unnamed protein product [Gemmata massiliana]|uniref:Uncharacterized protein n=1 Tax=Gemmata massiliana TaxID=1210884 RepID=A0A6P2CVD9_9BACT|nr:unnamed protein product [Gemmata massiliana]